MTPLPAALTRSMKRSIPAEYVVFSLNPDIALSVTSAAVAALEHAKATMTKVRTLARIDFPQSPAGCRVRLSHARGSIHGRDEVTTFVIASGARQSRAQYMRPLDCFVAYAPRNDGRSYSGITGSRMCEGCLRS